MSSTFTSSLLLSFEIYPRGMLTQEASSENAAHSKPLTLCPRALGFDHTEQTAHLTASLRGRERTCFAVYLSPFFNASVSCFREQLAEPQCPRPSPSLLSRSSTDKGPGKEFKGLCRCLKYILMMFTSICNSPNILSGSLKHFFFF